MGDSNAHTDVLYTTESLGSWDEVVEYFKSHSTKLDGWIFRGHRCSSWPLATALERSLTRLSVPLSGALDIELGLCRRFQRQAHLYSEAMSVYEPNYMETLALIQHHGGPTRLMDWTYSFFVAAFFAIEAASPDANSSCAIWAFDRDWWRERARCLLPDDVKRKLDNDVNAKHEDTVRALLRHDPPLKTIHPLNAFRLSERHIYQQGAFVVPGDVSATFMDNLSAIADPSGCDHMLKIEVKCTKRVLEEATKDLHRMNINRATLFPGLDGFARHLEQLIMVPRARAVDQF